jgi:hypothetical protein
MQDELIGFLERYEPWIYLVLGLAAVIVVQRLLRGWTELRAAMYGLEREIAQRKLTVALTWLILLVFLVIGEFVVASFVAPAIPNSMALPTPTLDFMATPTVTLPAPGNATATVSPQGGLTAEPAAEGCTPGVIEWISPQAGDSLSGSVVLQGTINVPNLGFYKYEYNQVGEESWTTIAAGNEPKVGGEIGIWNTGQLIPGDYLLRLVVADNENQLFPACIVQVRITTP